MDEKRKFEKSFDQTVFEANKRLDELDLSYSLCRTDEERLKIATKTAQVAKEAVDYATAYIKRGEQQEAEWDRLLGRDETREQNDEDEDYDEYEEEDEEVEFDESRYSDVWEDH